MLLIASLVFLVVTTVVMIAEAIGERDWPRDTWRFCAVALAIFLFFASVEL